MTLEKTIYRKFNHESLLRNVFRTGHEYKSLMDFNSLPVCYHLSDKYGVFYETYKDVIDVYFDTKFPQWMTVDEYDRLLELFFKKHRKIDRENI